jgi:hypothetical protein
LYDRRVQVYKAEDIKLGRFYSGRSLTLKGVKALAE